MRKGSRNYSAFCGFQGSHFPLPLPQQAEHLCLCFLSLFRPVVKSFKNWIFSPFLIVITLNTIPFWALKILETGTMFLRFQRKNIADTSLSEKLSLWWHWILLGHQRAMPFGSLNLSSPQFALIQLPLLLFIRCFPWMCFCEFMTKFYFFGGTCSFDVDLFVP